MLAIVGVPPPVAVERLTLSYVVTLSLADTVLLLSLIWVLLRAHGERPTELLLGRRPVAREAILGLLWVPGMLLLATTAFVLGATPGIEFIQSFPGAEGILHTDRVRAQTRGFYHYVVST